MSEVRLAIYPGTFDPITRGHMDVVAGELKICDKLVIGVAEDVTKKPIFTISERVEMANLDLQERGLSEHVVAKSFKGLLVDFARQEEASILIRGLRAVSDFEYEFQLAAMNTRLAPELQTIFIPATDKHQFLASKLVKEIARLGGDISPFVSSHVQKMLVHYFERKN